MQPTVTAMPNRRAPSWRLGTRQHLLKASLPGARPERRHSTGRWLEFSGLRELAGRNVAIFEEVKQLIPGRGDSSFPRAQVGGNSRSCQENLKELDNLVKIAKVLQEVAVSLAAACSRILHRG